MVSAAFTSDPHEGFAANAPKSLSQSFSQEALASGVVGYVDAEGARSVHDQNQSDTHEVFEMNPWEKSLQQKIIEAAMNGNVDRIMTLLDKAYMDLQSEFLDDEAFASRFEQILDYVDLAAYHLEAAGFTNETHQMLDAIYSTLGMEGTHSSLSIFQAIEADDDMYSGPLISASYLARMEKIALDIQYPDLTMAPAA